MTRRVARLGPGFIEIGTVDDGREKRLTLGALESAVLILADKVTTARAVRNRFEDTSSTFGQAVEDAIAKLVELGVAVRDHDRLVNVIPFEQPRTSAQLQTWLHAYGPALVGGCRDKSGGQDGPDSRSNRLLSSLEAPHGGAPVLLNRIDHR